MKADSLTNNPIYNESKTDSGGSDAHKFPNPIYGDGNEYDTLWDKKKPSGHPHTTALSDGSQHSVSQPANRSGFSNQDSSSVPPVSNNGQHGHQKNTPTNPSSVNASVQQPVYDVADHPTPPQPALVYEYAQSPSAAGVTVGKSPAVSQSNQPLYDEADNPHTSTSVLKPTHAEGSAERRFGDKKTDSGGPVVHEFNNLIYGDEDNKKSNSGGSAVHDFKNPIYGDENEPLNSKKPDNGGPQCSVPLPAVPAGTSGKGQPHYKNTGMNPPTNDGYVNAGIQQPVYDVADQPAHRTGTLPALVYDYAASPSAIRGPLANSEPTQPVYDDPINT